MKYPSLVDCAYGILIWGFICKPVAGFGFVGDFESGQIIHNPKWGQAYCCQHSVQIVTSPVRAGKYALKSVLYPSDPPVHGGTRAEVIRASEGKTVFDSLGQEYWYGFSLYFPNGWEPNSEAELVVQWHQMGDSGEVPQSPPLAFYINGSDMNLNVRWDARLVTPNNRPQGTATIWHTQVQTGRWIDFVFHIKWSFHSDGYVEFWKDDRYVQKHEGPNCHNDKRDGVFFKIGVYKWPWTYGFSSVAQRTMYYDEVRTADQTGSFEMVSPSQFRVFAHASPKSGYLPLDVNLEAIVNNGQAPFTFLWQLGDNNANHGQKPFHTFTGLGAYHPSVVAKDALLRTTDIAVTRIVVFEKKPFVVSPSLVQVPCNTMFGHKFKLQIPPTCTAQFQYLQRPSWVVTQGDTLYGMAPQEPDIDTVRAIVRVEQIQQTVVLVLCLTSANVDVQFRLNDNSTGRAAGFSLFNCNGQKLGIFGNRHGAGHYPTWYKSNRHRWRTRFLPLLFVLPTGHGGQAKKTLVLK